MVDPLSQLSRCDQKCRLKACVAASQQNSALQVDQWLQFADSVVNDSNLPAVLSIINEYLALRTFLVGYSLTVADLQVWGQLQGKSEM